MRQVGLIYLNGKTYEAISEEPFIAKNVQVEITGRKLGLLTVKPFFYLQAPSLHTRPTRKANRRRKRRWGMR